MGALADIFASVRLQLDGTGFEAQATALATKSGKNAGDQLSQNLSASLRRATLGVIGAGIGLAFGAMLSGANELDAATQKLRADTGMTADQAKVAETAMAGMYQHNLQGFAQIGDTLAVVTNGLDLTGSAADAMTEKFLKFETATGQDSAAVSAFHEILNAWSLTAEAAPHIMDLLVASHQKYGSSVTDNQAALQKLAPQMIALGMTIDDTVGLLNLFDAAGMDSSKAMFALNTAVKNLKPGQTLNDLIKQVTAITDPTLRAQEAIKIFGARGGVNLANALKPGITSLADFATSATDTVGATDKAAAAVESGFGNQATLILHQFGGALAEIGTNFGGLAMLASVVGPGMFRTLSAAFGGLAGLLIPKIAEQLGLTLPTWIAGGTAQGAAAAAAEVTAEGAGVAAGQAAVAAEAGPAAGLAGREIGTAMGKGAAAAALLIPIVWAIGTQGAAKPMDDAANAAIANLHAAHPEWAAAGTDSGAQFGAAFNTGWRGVIIPGVHDIGHAITAAAPSMYRAGQVLGTGVGEKVDHYMVIAQQQAMGKMAAAIIAGKSQLVSAWNTALTERNRAADIADQILVNNAQITAQRKILADGKSTAADKAQARITLRDTQAQNAELLVEATQYGTRAQQITKTKALLTSKALLDGLKSKDPDVRQHWIDVKTTAQTQLEALEAKTAAIGTTTVTNYATGLLAGKARVIANMNEIANSVLNRLPQHSPAKEGPLSLPGGPEGLGAHLIELYAAGMVSAIGTITAASDAGALAAMIRQPSYGGARTSPAFYAAPAMSVGAPAGSASTVPRGTSGGGDFNQTIQITGLVRARDPMEIATQARRFARLGTSYRPPVLG